MPRGHGRAVAQTALGCVLQTSGSDECHLNPDETPVASNRSVFVGNLASAVSERHLFSAFSECGPVNSLQVRLQGLEP